MRKLLLVQRVKTSLLYNTISKGFLLDPFSPTFKCKQTIGNTDLFYIGVAHTPETLDSDGLFGSFFGKGTIEETVAKSNAIVLEADSAWLQNTRRAIEETQQMGIRLYELLKEAEQAGVGDVPKHKLTLLMCKFLVEHCAEVHSHNVSSYQFYHDVESLAVKYGKPVYCFEPKPEELEHQGLLEKYFPKVYAIFRYFNQSMRQLFLGVSSAFMFGTVFGIGELIEGLFSRSFSLTYFFLTSLATFVSVFSASVIRKEEREIRERNVSVARGIQNLIETEHPDKIAIIYGVCHVIPLSIYMECPELLKSHAKSCNL